MGNFPKFNLLLFAGILLGLVACEKEAFVPEKEVNSTTLESRSRRPDRTLMLNISGLGNVGSDFLYEGWMIVNGQPFSSGTFSVDDAGRMSENVFTLDEQTLNNATTFVLTIEPYPDSDPAPSDVHILGGDFTNRAAPLTIGHAAAIGTNFFTAQGKFILATPTNGPDTDENSGIWFLQFSEAGPVTGLELPTLPNGWIYEGWSVVDGIPVTSGKFYATDEVDLADPFSGSLPGPPFPGEDFLLNAPAGLSFPLDLSRSKAVITVEPVPDNSPDPFFLKPLIGQVPGNALDHVVYDLRNQAARGTPRGRAIRM